MMNQHQTVGFSESEQGQTVGYSYRPDPTRDSVLQSADDSLAKFFERPLLASTYTWTPNQGAPFTANFNPWTAFFNNPRVINRINNYALMRANLHVRFVINGNGFYYGRLLADYCPLYSSDQVTAYSTLVTDNIVQASQRPHVFLDPSCACSQELYLPFVWYRDAVSVATAEWGELGRIFIREMQGLKHANAATQPITINVFLWATDVMMSMPTSVDSSALVAQAGEDEYGDTPVSAVASTAASVADKFSSLPVIGPYAKATSLAASGVSTLAKAMGLSRPAIIAPFTGMRPTYISALAPSDAGDNAQKLTYDSKQEVSVDPNIIGIDLPDELSIASLAAKEAWLTSFPWTTAAAAGTHLWNIRVTPSLVRFTSPNYYIPACSFATHPFKYWRGKMRYRFQVVCSDYHKGRLRIVWDPVYVQTLESNVQMTHIVDISTERDVTIEVDWGQTAHYLPCKTLNNGIVYNTIALASSDAESNGVLGVYVMNDLATPNSVANNDIAVNVFVSMVDAHVAAPVDRSVTETNPYSWVPQAGEDGSDGVDHYDDPGCDPCEPTTTMGKNSDTPEDALVYFGENILSMRQLLKRYVRHSTVLIPSPASATIASTWTAQLPDFPPYYGYNSVAMHTNVAGTSKVNYVTTTWLHYLVPAFVAVKGSHRTKYVVNQATPGCIQSLAVERGAINRIALPTTSTVNVVTNQSRFAASSRSLFFRGIRGGALTVPPQQPVLEVEFPWYKNIRFDEARLIDASTTLESCPQSESHYIYVTHSPGPATSSTLDRYVAVGEDFALHWFVGCPPISVLPDPV